IAPAPSDKGYSPSCRLEWTHPDRPGTERAPPGRGGTPSAPPPTARSAENRGGILASVWLALLLRRIALLPWKALKALGRAVRGCFRALRRPAGRLAVQCVVTALAVIGALAAGHYVVPSAGPAWSFGTEPEPAPEERPLVLSPEDAPAPGLPAETDEAADSAGAPTDTPTQEAADDLGAWARGLSHLGIPERALVSYGRAELVS